MSAGTFRMRREAAERAAAEAAAAKAQVEEAAADPVCEMPVVEAKEAVEVAPEAPAAEPTATVTKVKPKAPSRAS